ncbi:MAG TPA: glutamate--tRNA ligase [Candidatus Woesebacteria bacterium]|nr:glutamate--tRNA ligase [Candidatus Woesebacteria bacterium]
MSTVRTRIAPSPTGEYHIGHLRTCLYNYALAKKNHGQFILRIEDTDQKRFVPGAQERILKDIKDYGMTWDEGPDIGGPYGPYVQTQRLDVYQKYIRQLLDKGLAYYCFCSEDRLNEMRQIQKTAHQIPKYDRHCLNLSKGEIETKIKNGESYVIRLRVPDNQIITFTDAIRGQITINSQDIDDQVLIKSDGIPTYHFAVVVDDHLMKISHIFRGEEWITSTPKQIILYEAFGWEVPIFIHLTVLMDPSGHGKMSKRKGSVSARSFLDEGYLPEALLNFLMLLGWNPGTDRELFTLEEFIQEFSLEHLHKKSPIFDRKKLDYFNGLYIRQKSNEELFPYFRKFLPAASDEQIKILIPVLKERLIKFSDLPGQVKFLFEDIDYDKELLLKKGTSPELATEMLTKTKELLSDFTNLVSRIQNLVSTNAWNTGEFFMVFRVAICGSAFTPPVVECLPALGKEGTLHKIDIALQKLK